MIKKMDVEKKRHEQEVFELAHPQRLTKIQEPLASRNDYL